MIKLSPRLNLIASLVSHKNVIDIGCDHGLLSIYLSQKGHEVIASDISVNALSSAKENIKRYKSSVKTIVSDGIENIDVKNSTTAVIAGMGTSTILEILNNDKFKQVDEVIISSHNELEELREKLSDNFTITKEDVIFDKKYYVVMKLTNGRSRISKKDAYVGFNGNSEYSEYLYNKNLEILNRVPRKYILKRFRLRIRNRWLRELF